MTTTEYDAQILVEDEPPSDNLDSAIRDYVSTYALLRGRRKKMERFGVSRHTLWRFLDKGHLGRALPRAVLEAWATASRPWTRPPGPLKPRSASPPASTVPRETGAW